MKVKPWPLIILSVLHILSPIGNLILNAFRSERSLEAQWYFWLYDLPKPMLVAQIFLPMMAGIFIYICKRWSYFAYLGTVTLMLLGNLIVFFMDMNMRNFLIVAFVLIFDLLIVAYFVVPSVQKIYLDPRLRWWEAKPRYDLSVNGRINNQIAFIKNISVGGLFFTSGPVVKEGDQVDCSWDYEGAQYQIKGLIKYSHNSVDLIASGVQFLHTPESQKSINNLVDILAAKGLILRERLPTREQSFGTWLKNFITKGEGLFPKLS